MHVCRPPQDNPKTLNTQLYIQLFEKKLARFEQFARLYPECYWIFVGDNVQVSAAAKPAAAKVHSSPVATTASSSCTDICSQRASHDREVSCPFELCMLWRLCAVLPSTALPPCAQGDVLLAERLDKVLTRGDGRSSLVATFIHRVVPTLETISSLRSRKSNKAAWLAAWKDQRIFFNRTPIGMATQVPLAAAGPWLPPVLTRAHVLLAGS